MLESPAPHRRTFAPGALIIEEGSQGQEAYVVERGQVSVFKTIKDRTVTIGTVKPGGIFGEMALIDNQPRMASVVADEETVCLVIPKSQLTLQLGKAPKGVRAIVGALLGNIRLMGSELAETRILLAEEEAPK